MHNMHQIYNNVHPAATYWQYPYFLELFTIYVILSYVAIYLVCPCHQHKF